MEVEATEAAKTAGWVSPGDYLTHISGGRRGHGSRVLRTAHGLCGSRTATLLALTAGDVSPEHAEVIVAVIDRLPVDSSIRDEAERVLLDQAASLNASELRKAGDHLLAGAREIIYQRSLPLATENLRIVSSKAGEGAGVVGAAVMVIDHCLSARHVETLVAGA